MAARHDMEDLPLVCHLRHRVRNAGIDVAQDHGDLIAIDQLFRLLYAGADIVGRILDEELDLAAKNATLLVDFSLGVFGAVHFALRQRRQHAGERIDHADLDRLVAERANNIRGGNDLARAERHAGLEDSAATNGRMDM